MLYELTNPSGRLVVADDEALIAIVLRGDREQFTLHTKVDPKLFTDRAAVETLKDNQARLHQAAQQWHATPKPGAEPEATPSATPAPAKSK